jgi:hypothetical protein
VRRSIKSTRNSSSHRPVAEAASFVASRPSAGQHTNLPASSAATGREIEAGADKNRLRELSAKERKELIELLGIKDK